MIYILILMYLLVLSSDALNSHRTARHLLTYSTKPTEPTDTLLFFSAHLHLQSTHLQHSPTALTYSTRLQHSLAALTYSTHSQHSPTALTYSTRLQHSPTALTFTQHSPTVLAYSIHHLQHSPTALAATAATATATAPARWPRACRPAPPVALPPRVWHSLWLRKPLFRTALQRRHRHRQRRHRLSVQGI